MTHSWKWLAATLVMAAPALAEAQQVVSPYIGITAGTHIERSQDFHDSAPSIGVVGGIRFARAWAAEVEYSRPTQAFVKERTCRCVSFATTAADFDRLAATEHRRDQRDVLSTLSIGAVYQPELGRWTPRLYLGVTGLKLRESSESVYLAVPPGYESRLNERRTFANTRGIGGPSFGAGVSYRLTSHLSVGGDAKYVYASLGDEINNAWRTSMRTTWTF